MQPVSISLKKVLCVIIPHLHQPVDDFTGDWELTLSFVQTESHQHFLARQRTLIYFWEKKDTAFYNYLLRDRRHRNAFVKHSMDIQQL